MKNKESYKETQITYFVSIVDLHKYIIHKYYIIMFPISSGIGFFESCLPTPDSICRIHDLYTRIQPTFASCTQCDYC